MKRIFSRRLHGRRGLKLKETDGGERPLQSRRLHGRRGLKFDSGNRTEFATGVAAFTGGVD